MGISSSDFEFVRDYVRRNAAIVLEPGKEYLVESRLRVVMQRENLGSFEELLAPVRRDGGHALGKKIVEAMTTNETFFFRDLHPFDALRTSILPSVIKARSSMRTLSIWSAASSSGQEAYSIAMLVREHFPELANWNVRIVGTDISAQMVERARSGCYSQLEVNRGLPVQLLIKYFSKQGVEWHISEKIRQMVEFREMNLAGEWPGLPPFDIVMLRNILIYFDVPMKREIVSRIRKVAARDAYLFLGAVETMMEIDSNAERVDVGKCRCYRLV